MLNLLFILGQRKATTDAGLIQCAWYVSDVTIVWDSRRVTFTCFIVTVFLRERRHPRVSLGSFVIQLQRASFC